MNYNLKYFTLFILFLISTSNFSIGQDQKHVSHFFSNELRVYPYEANFDPRDEFLIQQRKYIQTETGEIIENPKFDTYYNNDKYPDRDSSEELFRKESILTFESNIPPALDSMPDGQYVQYYAPIPYEDGDTIKFIRNRIAIIYEMKDNAPHGESHWFLPSNQIQYKTGLYEFGKREGMWNFDYRRSTVTSLYPKNLFQKYFKRKTEKSEMVNTISCNYVNNLKDGEEIIKESYGPSSQITTYKNGLKNGPYKYILDSNVMVKGSFNDNIQSGEWFFYGYKRLPDDYLHDGDIFLEEHYIVNDQKIKGKGEIIRKHFFYENKNIASFGVGIVDGTYILNGIEPIQMYPKPENFKNFYTKLNVDYDENGESIEPLIKDSFDYILKYLEYERYYSDGKPFIKFSSINGNLIQQNDTIYRDNGKIANILLVNEKTNEFELHFYDKKGELKQIEYYDSSGYSITHRKIGDLTFHNLYGNWSYHNSTSLSKKSTETYFLHRLRRDAIDFHIIEQITYNPSIYQGIIDRELLDTFISLKGEFQLDSALLTSTYSQKINIGTLQIRSIIFDSLLNNQYYTFYKPKITDITYRDEVLDFGELSETDQYQLFKNEKAFTGKLIVHFVEVDTFYTLEKSDDFHIYMQTSKIQQLKSLFPNLKELLPNKESRDPYSSTFFDEEEIVDQKNYKFYNAKTVSFPFDNGKITGTIEIKNHYNKKLALIPCLENIINGQVKLYSNYPGYFPYRQPEKDNDYFLSDIMNYKNGELNGLFIRYKDNGDILSQIQYPIKPLEGEQKRVNGSTIELTNYKNGLRHGPYEYKDTSNDFRFICNYINDSIHGQVEEFQKGKLIRKGIFNHGALTDTLFEYNLDGQITSGLIYNQNHFVKELIFHEGLLKSELANTSEKNKMGISGLRTFKVNYLYNHSIHYFDKIDSTHVYYDNFNFDSRSGYYKEYSTEGKVVKEGNLLNERKVGLWKYDYPQTHGDYTINYFDSIIWVNDSLSFKTVGYFEQKDSTGKFLSKRFLLSDTVLYNCSQGETYEIETYFTLFENDTNQHLMNGSYRHYYPNGVIQSEGANKNGLPEGTWKFYNDNGSLRETGRFQNGKKTGRWLSGDLSKIHYLGDLCFDLDNEEMANYMTDLENTLEITECFYSQGIVVSMNKFTISK